MARRSGEKSRGAKQGDETERADDAPAAASDGSAAPKSRPKPDSPVKLWLEEAWHGWVKSMSGLLVLALAYVAYSQHWIGEGTAGVLLVTVIVAGTIGLAAAPVFGLLAGRRSKGLFGAFVAVWLVAAGFGPMDAALPGREVVTRHLGDTKTHVEEQLTLQNESGPYSVIVSGALKGEGDVEVPYRLTVAGATSEDLSGTLSRKFVSLRVGRKGGTRKQANDSTEKVYRTQVKGGQLKLALDIAESDFDKLDGGVTVSVRRQGPDPMLFFWLACAFVLAGLVIDFRLAAPKVKTYLGMAGGTVAVFAGYFPTVATPHFLVPPAIESVVIAFVTGGLGATLVGFVARSYKKMPKPTRVPAAKR